VGAARQPRAAIGLPGIGLRLPLGSGS
jgi:hypothetical protein